MSFPPSFSGSFTFWTPAILGADLALWLPPSGIIPGEGTAYGWYDSSLHHYNYVDAFDTGITPTTTAALSNGLVGVVFDGVHDNNVIPTPLLPALLPNGTFHVFLVLKPTGPGDAAVPPQEGYSYIDDQASTFGIYLNSPIAGPDQIYLEADDDNFFGPYYAHGTVTPNTTTIVEGWQASDRILRVRVAGVTGTPSAVMPSAATFVGDFHIGTSPDCVIGELILVNRSLTPTEQASMRAYLAAEWAVPA